MTNIQFIRKKNRFHGFIMKGHAGAGNGGEYDMVCAAISGIAYTTLGALDELCEIHTFSEADGAMQMKLPEKLVKANADKAQIILKTMEIGFMQIQRQYPKYISITFKEV